jgi:alpha-L-rhamnosidase
MRSPERFRHRLACSALVAGLLLAAISTPAAEPPRVADLRTEYATNPLGIDVKQPRLSWRLVSELRGVVQSAWQVQVASSPEALADGDLVWDSGRVESSASIHRPYAGAPLASGRRYHWRVRIWDGSGAASQWSRPAWWEMGLLDPGDWRARWIEPELEEDTTRSNPAPLLRREFEVQGDVVSARAWVTSHGLYEMHLNARRVGDQLFTPGWTSYSNRLQYQSYDVADLLVPGTNALGVTLGDGWYRGRLGWRKGRNLYGERLGLLLQLRIVYGDGREQLVTSDESWKASTGSILMSDIYDGEVQDARLEPEGWRAPGFDDAGWSGVRLAGRPEHQLIAPVGPPVRRIQELRPVEILTTPAGDTVVDMGQNMVGWVRLWADGEAGTEITLRHAEVLDAQGNFYTDNLRSAAATARYTLAGGGREQFEPHFSFFGFRYVAVEGYPGELGLDDLEGVVIHSDMRVTGSFETSNPLIDQLQSNIIWGQKGNFLDVPTDCPQRDERLGWTGDAQVFFRTAAFNTDVAGFFTRWLGDLAADQLPSGAVPHVIPDVLSSPERPEAGAAGWADAAVRIPWELYLAYGDERILARQYESMSRWVDYMRRRAGDDAVWDGDTHFGDWLAYASDPGRAPGYPGATTGTDFIATAFLARSTELLRRSASVLGKREDAERLAAQRDEVVAALLREFVTETGRVAENTQTAYALALAFDLLPESQRGQAAERLAGDTRRRGHLTTGFLGTPHLLRALSSSGHLDEAYRLLLREEYPSWLYPVTQGATTIWERWDGRKPDGSFQTPGMNSFNHYAYGAVGDWMYRVMAGIEIDPGAPGYARVRIAPRPGGGFTRVAGSHESMYGRVASAWRLEQGRFLLDVEIPPNTSATLRLPAAVLGEVREGRLTLDLAEGVSGARQEGPDVVLDLGSGRYAFAYPFGG